MDDIAHAVLVGSGHMLTKPYGCSEDAGILTGESNANREEIAGRKRPFWQIANAGGEQSEIS